MVRKTAPRGAQVQQFGAGSRSRNREQRIGAVIVQDSGRLTPDEADDLIAQLPSLLQATLYSLATGPDKLVTRATIEQELTRRLDVEPSRAAEILIAVGGTVAQSISAGQVKDVQGQLPEALRDVFSRAPASAS
jgi:uncharacterized protein (DUF2267 family)